MNDCTIQKIENRTFEGERPLFKSSSIDLINCQFTQGESALKLANNVHANMCTFSSKYLFWHDNHIKIIKSKFTEGGRASIWYSNDIMLKDCEVNAPKIFRDAKNILIIKSVINTNETLWDCENINISNSNFTGDYLLFHSINIMLNHFNLDGNYSFQHTKNMTIKNANIKSKDAFWNSENITVYDSVIEGEYLGWYSKNLTLINCTIKGTQPLCYIENVKLENCTMIDTDLAFEYSTVEAKITSSVQSIKNPTSGVIDAKSIDELILDDENVLHEQLHITTQETKENTYEL